MKTSVYLFSLVSLFSSFLWACNNSAPDVVSIASNSNINMQSEGPVEMELGQTGYLLNLPGIYAVSETKGKEGQLGFTISSKDSSNHVFGFIEIKKGLGIQPKTNSAKPFIKATFNGSETQWQIQRTETGYYEAFTPIDREVRARISSDREQEVKELAMLMATLRKG
jgi:hypothetical protein